MPERNEYRVTKSRRIMGLPQYRIELVIEGRWLNVCPAGETLEDLRADVLRMLAALDKPVLEKEHDD